ncbi:hypothetical protein BV25DRAFT_1802708 [Artomyces pyxidatus]|uniref:Uncharacterized protein n=1 Tax=Artomyces pyxidatus TaxID=48021 RepID=A0ACB8T4V0_9AGAM|nr:hypothetical protein BV25DRAFT_1802708 [Artomyces pyxidatus]
MYHAESFAKLQFETYLIGYEGATPVSSLLSLPHVHFLYLPPLPTALGRLPFLALAPIKVAHQVVSILLALLWRMPPPEFLIVQNPPSIPTLALVWLAARVRGSKVIIDWHNLGYSILALRFPRPGHPLVVLAKWFEKTFGRTAYAHLFVTRAMRDRLVKDWDLQGIKAVLHDRPPGHFHRASPSETHELFLRLAPSLPTSFLPKCNPPYSTPLTTVHPTSSTPSPMFPSPSPSSTTSLDMPDLRADRPAVLVSSTSWTPDEDFGVLLAALAQYEARARALAGRLPRLLALVTGRGPQRATYMREIQRRADAERWAWVACVSLWLEAEDYPLLLGSADIGVSLHASSSALDLPMKVVDMFGCGLPVCALDFACLDELVKDGKNGLVFRTAEQLAQQLETLLTGFPQSPALDSLRASLERGNSTSTANRGGDGGGGAEAEWGSWDDNWTRVVKRLVVSGPGS